MPITIDRPRAHALIRGALRCILIALAALLPAPAFAEPASAASVSAAASPATALGRGVLTDTATVTGWSPEAGATLTFRLHGPGDPTCAGTPLFISIVPYPTTGAGVKSAPFTPQVAGTYRWRAEFSAPSTSTVVTACDDAAQSTLVRRAVPVVNVSPAATGATGAVTLTASAAVVDRASPAAGATIDFRLYGPTDTACAGAPVFQSLAVPYPVAEGAVGSAPYAPPAPGTYRWTASYSGDPNNEPAVSGCSAPTTVVASTPPPCPTCAPRNSLPPVIGGRATRGSQLSCGAGVWTGIAPIAFAYRWLRDGAQVAEGATYRVVTADVRRKLACEVTASNPAGTATAGSESVTAVAPSTTVPIAVRGVIAIRAPSGVPARQSCKGSVTLTLLRGTRSLGRRTVRLDARCRWSHTFRIGHTRLGTTKKLRLEVRFGGNRYARSATVTRTVRLQS